MYFQEDAAKVSPSLASILFHQQLTPLPLQLPTPLPNHTVFPVVRAKQAKSTVFVLTTSIKSQTMNQLRSLRRSPKCQCCFQKNLNGISQKAPARKVIRN